jgi:hypothetical protein
VFDPTQTVQITVECKLNKINEAWVHAAAQRYNQSVAEYLVAHGTEAARKELGVKLAKELAQIASVTLYDDETQQGAALAATEVPRLGGPTHEPPPLPKGNIGIKPPSKPLIPKSR